MTNQDLIYIYPTDTVWGIGCNIFSETGFLEIAKIKKTKSDKPLSILFPNPEVLKKFFELEDIFGANNTYKIFEFGVTLLIPKNKLIGIFPNYLLNLSEYISIRLIENSVTKKIFDQIQSPFFSTSLNITSEPPIVNDQDAFHFYKQYCSGSVFIANEGGKLSGISSTIIKIENNKAAIIRVGANQDLIINYLSELNLL